MATPNYYGNVVGGTLSATSASISGALSAGATTLGALTGTTANFSGAVTASDFIGTLDAGINLGNLGMFNVKFYGAKGDGTTDDATAIGLAITAASTLGGVVYFPPATYAIGSSLTLPPGVYLQGYVPQRGQTPATTPIGSVLKGISGLSGSDAIVTSSLANACGVLGLTLLDCGYGGAWAIHILGSTGLIIRDVAIVFISAESGNGINLDGGSNNVIAARLDNVSIVSGNGYVGGVGLQLGTSGGASHITNASLFTNVEIVGFTTGVNVVGGGGNTFISPWVQSCTTGFALGTCNNTQVYGGWTEANTTNYTLASGAVQNHFYHVRDAGGSTTFVSGSGIGSTSITNANKFINCNGFNPVGVLSSQPNVPGSGLGWTNGTGTDVTIYIAADSDMTGIGIGAANNLGISTAQATVKVPVGQSIILSYSSGTPTWVVVGD